MTRPIYIKIPVSQQQRVLEIRTRLLQVLLAASLFAAFFAGLFPFDFAIPPGGISYALHSRWDWSWNPYDPHLTDRTENIFFLMPLGFSAAGLLLKLVSNKTGWLAALFGFVCASITSIALECSQTLVSFRDPSWADVWCNALGGAIGGALFFYVGRRVLFQLARGLVRIDRHFSVRNRLILLIAYATAQVALPLLLHRSGELTGWDATMPLLVGNEINAVRRAWNGVVQDVCLADRAAEPEQLAAIARGAAANKTLGTSVLAAYRFVGDGPYLDSSGHEKPLIWAGGKPGTATSAGILTSPTDWLRSDGNVSRSVDRIRETSQFTLCTTAATLDPGQREIAPLRIVSISNGTAQRNVTLGQDIGDWVVRVRTAVANMPDFYLHDVFADTSVHALAVTASRGLVVAYVDGIERGRCEITPEAKMIWRLYPRGAFKIYIDGYGYRSYAWIYRLLVMLPFGLLLGFALKPLLRSWTWKRVAALAAVLAMAGLLEGAIWVQGGMPPSGWNVAVSVVLGAVAQLVLLRRRRAR